MQKKPQALLQQLLVIIKLILNLIITSNYFTWAKSTLQKVVS